MIKEDTPYMQKNWLLRLYQDTVNVRTMRESNFWNRDEGCAFYAINYQFVEC